MSYRLAWVGLDKERNGGVRPLYRLAIKLWALLALSTGIPSIAAPGEPPRPSVILISLDTLRADHLSAYGYNKIHTPHIDAFAADGTRFAAAEAQVPLTLPSHTGLFTSTYPFENGVEENGERVPAGVVTLAGVLRSHGYQTAAFIGSDFLDRRYGLDQGFDVYDSPFAHVATGIENPLAMSLRRDGALVVRAARQWLEAQRAPAAPANSRPGTAPLANPPVFLFVHLFDLHVPYTLPPEVAQQRGISRYDAQLEYIDQVLGRFQQDLKRDGWWDQCLIVVFGDHGEGLGDHGESDHGYYVYESTLHVPLLVHWPAGAPHFAAVLRTPVGLIDVAPTILDYLRVPAPASFEGQSQLAALKSGESAAPRPVYSESLYAHDAFQWAPLRTLLYHNYKYIEAPRAELYNLEADPHELLNLLHAQGAIAAQLQNELTALLARYAPKQRPSPAPLAPETIAELESLGYLAAQPRSAGARQGASNRDAAAPDPKDRFAEFQLYQTAYVDFTEGRAAAALPKFQSILKADPSNTLARFHLGECYLELKQPQNALREWGATLKLDPEYAPAAESIGQYWLAQGDYAKARLRFLQVLALAPASYTGHFQLAMADEHLGLLPEAREHLAAACKLAPHDEKCARQLQQLAGER